jgi:hypothetical protein
LGLAGVMAVKRKIPVAFVGIKPGHSFHYKVNKPTGNGL